MATVDTVYIKHDKFNCTKLLASYVSLKIIVIMRLASY